MNENGGDENGIGELMDGALLSPIAVVRQSLPHSDSRHTHHYRPSLCSIQENSNESSSPSSNNRMKRRTKQQQRRRRASELFASPAARNDGGTQQPPQLLHGNQESTQQHNEEGDLEKEEDKNEGSPRTPFQSSRSIVSSPRNRPSTTPESALKAPANTTSIRTSYNDDVVQNDNESSVAAGDPLAFTSPPAIKNPQGLTTPPPYTPVRAKNASESSQPAPEVEAFKSGNSSTSRLKSQGPSSQSRVDETTAPTPYSSCGGETQTSVMNVSAFPTPASHSTNDTEIIRNQAQLGNAFIQRIHGAARLRKMALTRSRDSLALKEEEQLKANAVAKQREETAKQEAIRSVTFAHKPTVFKARPLPSTTGFTGSGGLSGVPKVDKRPVTQPKSPAWGGKRPEVRKPAAETPAIPGFQARPRPCTTGRLPNVTKRPVTVPESPRLGSRRETTETTTALSRFGSQGIRKVAKRPNTVAESPLLGSRRATIEPRVVPGGARFLDGSQGIRKVAKRPGTVPESPLLGNRRATIEPRVVPDGALGLRRVQRRPPTVPESPLLGSRRPVLNRTGPNLLGLNLKENKKNTSPQTPPSSEETIIRPFIPHSTRRAGQRAMFEKQRREQAIRLEQEHKAHHHAKVKALECRLSTLRMSI